MIRGGARWASSLWKSLRRRTDLIESSGGQNASTIVITGFGSRRRGPSLNELRSDLRKRYTAPKSLYFDGVAPVAVEEAIFVASRQQKQLSHLDPVTAFTNVVMPGVKSFDYAT